MSGRRHAYGAALAVLALIITVLSPSGHSSAAAAALPLASTELRSPAVTSLAPGRTDAFTRAPAGNLLYRYRPAGGSWTRALDLGGILLSQPAAVSWAPGRLDVFVRGADDALWHKYFQDGQGWSAWTSSGGIASSTPAAASWGPGRLDVVVRGADDGLWHKSYVDGAGWSGWEDLGGRLTSQPAAAAPGSGFLDLAAIGADGAMWSRRYVPGSGWTAWSSLGGGFFSGPGAHAVGGSVRILGAAPDDYLYESVRSSPTASWSSWTRVDPLLPFRHLGTWVDVFDYAALDPATAVADMAARGVRVLYLSTARYNGTSDFFDATKAGQWLDAAHAAGLKVVGWYVPAYGNMTRDVRRTVAISAFVSAGGQRFDAVGVDIERLDEVSRPQFNTLLVTHLVQVRQQSDAVIGAIVPSPYTTDPGNNWEGFPWASVGQNSEVVVPMALWSFRDNFSPDQVYAWVLDQVRRAQNMSGRPVNVEGGVDEPGAVERTPVTADRVSRFVDAAIDGGAIGGSHYDYRTTDPSFWPILGRLNR